MQHKNHEMLEAYISNTSLVIFCKTQSGRWERSCAYDLLVGGYNEYFMCLPKNEAICLNWLNGKSVQVKVAGREEVLSSVSECKWYSRCVFMLDSYDISYVPKVMWYEKLNEYACGVLCHVYDHKENKEHSPIRLVTKYDKYADTFKFITNNGNVFKYADPISDEELKAIENSLALAKK